MDGTKFIVIMALGGFGLLFLEIFLPSLVAGILGVALLLVSVAAAHTQFGVKGALVAIFGELSVLLVGFLAWSRYFPKTALGRRMLLTEFGAPAHYDHEDEFSIGEEGVAVSELRPAGTAEFKGKRCDVVSESAFIAAGDKIKIHQIEKYRVVVRKS